MRLGSVPVFDHGFLNINAKRNYTKVFYLTSSTTSKYLQIFFLFSLLIFKRAPETCLLSALELALLFPR